MKTILAKLTLIYLSIALCVLTSCKKDRDTEVFSCDPQINTWAHNNLKDVQSISYSEICQWPIEKQRAAFRATAPETRLILWKEKLNKILELQWTFEERHHIELLMNFIKVSHFAQPDNIEIIKEQKERDAFFKTWLFYCTEKLGWSPNLIKSIVVRFNFKSTNGKIIEESIRQIDGIVPPPPNPDCECSVSSDFCGPEPLGYCKSSELCSQYIGCGFLWSYNCNGMCTLGIPDGNGT